MISAKYKLDFFNDDKLLKQIGRAKHRSMMRSGALIRKIAQRSIRPRKKISAPGSPPHSHTKVLRKLIVFAYDRTVEELVVGPLPAAGGEAPSALEFGGKSTVLVRRRSRDQTNRRRTIVVRPRPFMGPALETAEPMLAKIFKNSVTK